MKRECWDCDKDFETDDLYQEFCSDKCKNKWKKKVPGIPVKKQKTLKGDL